MQCIGFSLPAYVQVQQRIAATIAMSLPGASELLPFLHSVAASYVGAAVEATSAKSHHDLSRGPLGHLYFTTHQTPFLHRYPHWVEFLRSQRAAKRRIAGDAATNAANSEVAASVERSGRDKHESLAYPVAAQAQASSAPGSDPHIVRSDVIRGTVVHQLSDGGRAVELSEGATAYAAISGAATEMADVVAELVATSGAGALESSGVVKALAGAYGRREQREVAAFLQMRTVRHSIKLALAHAKLCSHPTHLGSDTVIAAGWHAVAVSSFQLCSADDSTSSRAMQAEVLMRKQIIVNTVRSLPALQPRSLNTSNSARPLYTPLSSATMSRASQQLRSVWTARNAEAATAVKTARRLALVSMHHEIAEWRDARATLRSRERAAAAEATHAADAAQAQAARVRVEAAGRRRERQGARAAARRAAAAAGAALSAEARIVRGADWYKAAQREEVAVRASARAKWLQRLDAQEGVYERKTTRIKAAAAHAESVRAQGYTQAVHDHQAAAWYEQAAAVAAVKAARDAGRARVGPAGGVWGGAVPWEIARDPYPMAFVVAASENLPPQVRFTRVYLPHRNCGRNTRTSHCRLIPYVRALDTSFCGLRCDLVWRSVAEKCMHTDHALCSADEGAGGAARVHGRRRARVRRLHDHHHWQRRLARCQGGVWAVRGHLRHRVWALLLE